MMGTRVILEGRVLRDVRELRGATQVEVAHALGKPQSFVSKSETGERALKVDELFEFAEVLGLNPERLVTLMREALEEHDATLAQSERPDLLVEHWDDLPRDVDEEL